MRSILIVKCSAIGDVIQTFDVLEYLRRHFPNARIDWIVEESIAPLLQAHPAVNDVLVVNTKKWRQWTRLFSSITETRRFLRTLSSIHYDVLFDLQGNTKSALITFFARAREKVGFGRRSVAEFPNLFATNVKIEVNKEAVSAREKYLALISGYLRSGPFDDFSLNVPSFSLKLNKSEKEELETFFHLILEKKPALLVCFGAKWKNKQLKEETLAALLLKIKETFAPQFILTWGTEEEKEVAERLKQTLQDSAHTMGGKSLPFMQALMGKTHAILATDSALLHLSGMTETPTFGLFGPSSAGYYKPKGEKQVAFQGECPYAQTFATRCRRLRSCPTGACLRELSVEKLFTEFSLFWNRFVAQKN